jgi:CheY-like chemotaxis protein
VQKLDTMQKLDAVLADDLVGASVVPGFRQLQVLIVEDDPADLALIERALRRMTDFEAQITVSGSIAAARQTLRLAPFDIVLVDHALGSESGLGLAPSPAGRGLPCPAILVTGLLTPELKTVALHRGFSACIEKDELTPRILEAIVGQAITAHRLQQQVDRLESQLTAPDLQQTGSPDVFDLRGLLLDVLAGLGSGRAGDGERRLTVTLDMTGRGVLVRGDELEVSAALERVLAKELAGRLPGRSVDIRLETDDAHARILTIESPEGVNCGPLSGGGEEYPGSVIAALPLAVRLKCHA